MTIDEQYLLQLYDCFNAGYTLPQFCIDNDIKKPLIVGTNESQINFMWGLHTQFHYDVRISADFALIKGECEKINFSFSNAAVKDFKIENIFNLNTDDYDRIIILASGNQHNQKIVYLNQLLGYCNVKAYVEVPVSHFIQKNPGVKLVQINTPSLASNKNLNEIEKKILEENNSIGTFRKKIESARSKGETIPTPYDFLGYSNEDVMRLLNLPGQKLNPNKSFSLNDDEYLKIKDGHRMTAYQPKNYKNKIYILGGCVLYGYGVPWDRTVESHLQKLLNENILPYCVENESRFTFSDVQYIFYVLDSLEVKSGDIIFLNVYNMLNNRIPSLDVSNILDRPHNYGEVFPDPIHINENGHKALADYIFKVLVSNNFFRDTEFEYPPPPQPFHRYGIPTENSISPQSFLQNAELEEYKKKLREKRFAVGAIVMNCNPFTLGHECLIEYASKRVKKLFIFVVEEDKSEFKFADRFELVKRGVKKFSNVEVLPSGKFIISQQTFSGYFNKENLQDVAVDSSEDVEIFAREIAPSLGITVRFVGEEPEDSVTRQYNENMKRILPQYNIELCEIPRKILNGEIISAKKVREALHLKDFDKIKKLVPKTTLKFLLENFN